MNVAVLQREACARETAFWLTCNRPSDARATLPTSTARSPALQAALRAHLALDGEPLDRVCGLVHTFAEVLTEARGAGADEPLGVRLQAICWAEGAPRCSRFHEDNVSLRMVVALAGEGTTWLSERPGRRAGMRLASSAPWLDADWANALVCAPGEAVRRVGQADALFLKGRRWGRGSAAAIHRSPDVRDLGADGARLPAVRALLTVDYSGR